MTEEFTTQALAYLLEELDPQERAQFELQLQADPAAAAEFKAIADQLGAYAAASAPTTPLSAAARAAMEGAILHAATRDRVMSFNWRRVAWPIAAAVLLAVNIVQWVHHRRSTERDDLTGSAVASSDTNYDATPVSKHQAGAPVTPVLLGSRRKEQPAPTPAPSPAPAIRQTIIFSITQTTVTANVLPRPATPEPPAAVHGTLELRNLPRVPADRVLYLWVRRGGAADFEPVAEIPSQIYGGSGTVNYTLRPGDGTPARFMITIEAQHTNPASPSKEVVCEGP